MSWGSSWSLLLPLFSSRGLSRRVVILIPCGTQSTKHLRIPLGSLGLKEGRGPNLSVGWCHWLLPSHPPCQGPHLDLFLSWWFWKFTSLITSNIILLLVLLPLPPSLLRVLGVVCCLYRKWECSPLTPLPPRLPSVIWDSLCLFPELEARLPGSHIVFSLGLILRLSINEAQPFSRRLRKNAREANLWDPEWLEVSFFCPSIYLIVWLGIEP